MATVLLPEGEPGEHAGRLLVARRVPDGEPAVPVHAGQGIRAIGWQLPRGRGSLRSVLCGRFRGRPGAQHRARSALGAAGSASAGGRDGALSPPAGSGGRAVRRPARPGLKLVAVITQPAGEPGERCRQGPAGTGQLVCHGRRCPRVHMTPDDPGCLQTAQRVIENLRPDPRAHGPLQLVVAEWAGTQRPQDSDDPFARDNRDDRLSIADSRSVVPPILHTASRSLLGPPRFAHRKTHPASRPSPGPDRRGSAGARLPVITRPDLSLYYIQAVAILGRTVSSGADFRWPREA
jgi:hypothetical protein